MVVTFVENQITEHRNPGHGAKGKGTSLHHYLELARKGTGKVRAHHRRLYRHGQTHHPRGVHDFQNLQWDPSIYRGKTFKDFREKNMPPFTTAINPYKYCCSDPKLQTMPTTTNSQSNRHKKLKLGLPKIKVGGVFRPTTDDIIDEAKEGRKRKQQLGSTGMGWEEFIIEQAESPIFRDSTTQSDKIPESFQPSSITQKKGVSSSAVVPSKSTQVSFPYVGEAEKYDPINPTILSVGSKIVEQSLLESMEEEELRQISLEVRKFLNKRMLRNARAAKLIENEMFMAELRMEERITLEKHIRREEEAEERIAATIFCTQISKRIVDGAFFNLQKLEFIQTMGSAVSMTMEPYFNEGVERLISPVANLLFKDIIENANVHIETDAMLQISDHLQTDTNTNPPNSEMQDLSRKPSNGVTSQQSEAGINNARKSTASEKVKSGTTIRDDF